MKEIITERLILRSFRESEYDDLYGFLSQLRDDEFEGYPGITYENGRVRLTIDQVAIYDILVLDDVDH